MLAIPFALVDVPPILDYPNHLARYFVLAHPGDAVLSLMYAPHWGIQPNLGMDILGVAILRVAAVDRPATTRAAAALSPVYRGS